MGTSRPAAPCPAWSDDHPQDPVFDAVLESAVAALERSAELGPPTRALIDRWHLRVFGDVVPVEYYAGNVRQVNPTMPCLGVGVRVGPYVGTPAAQVVAACDNLFGKLAKDIDSLESEWDEIPDTDRARRFASIVAWGVGEFIKIHPYVNGNGRSSRALRRALMWRFGVPDAEAVHKRPDPPYGEWMAAAMQGKWHVYLAVIIQRLIALGPGGGPAPRRKAAVPPSALPMPSKGPSGPSQAGPPTSPS